MVPFGPVTHTPLTTIHVDGRVVRVTLHTAHDGIELVGRLFFAEQEWANNGIPDRGVLPGRSLHDVELLARDLRPEELTQRYRRANAEKRRFHGLRQLTLELLSKVRYMNQVAVSVRTGLLDGEAASQEMDLTEEQMGQLVKQVRHLAGIEG
ncbi:hypothetical protein [Gemmatimonas groenlandica]|uniref:Uncharacterized protein n=1 Tax=Gemmatimonas groenlandica TaxID=2732249 RepID=A0A6M4IR42_9BACT|nr:hypothetical protein [Gemmatimonas groenlandica]QJR36249.1 hypothetical protein HKW67_12395 [Gemmatimonas groenlandica]